jgi:hypothetical protein
MPPIQTRRPPDKGLIDMAEYEYEGKFEYDLFAIANRISGFDKPEDFKNLQDTKLTKRVNRLWEFTARRAALEDAGEHTANVLKPRVAAVGIFVSGALGNEDWIASDFLKAFAESAADNRFQYLALKVLEPESYGAVLFVEDREPTTLEKFGELLRKILAGTAHRIAEKSKDKAVSGLITATVLGAAIIIGPRIPDPYKPHVENMPAIVVMKCDDDKIFDMQRDIVNAHGSKDIQVAVNKYCKIVPNDPENWIPR